MSHIGFKVSNEVHMSRVQQIDLVSTRSSVSDVARTPPFPIKLFWYAGYSCFWETSKLFWIPVQTEVSVLFCKSSNSTITRKYKKRTPVRREAPANRSRSEFEVLKWMSIARRRLLVERDAMQEIVQIVWHVRHTYFYKMNPPTWILAQAVVCTSFVGHRILQEASKGEIQPVVSPWPQLPVDWKGLSIATKMFLAEWIRCSNYGSWWCTYSSMRAN